MFLTQCAMTTRAPGCVEARWYCSPAKRNLSPLQIQHLQICRKPTLLILFFSLPFLASCTKNFQLSFLANCMHQQFPTTDSLQAAAFRIADQDIPSKKLHKEFSSQDFLQTAAWRISNQEFLQANHIKNLQPRVLASKSRQEIPTKISSKLHEDFPDQEYLQAAIQNFQPRFFLASYVKNFQPRFPCSCNSEFSDKDFLQATWRISGQDSFLQAAIQNFQLRFLSYKLQEEFPKQKLPCKLQKNTSSNRVSNEVFSLTKFPKLCWDPCSFPWKSAWPTNIHYYVELLLLVSFWVDFSSTILLTCEARNKNVFQNSPLKDCRSLWRCLLPQQDRNCMQ